MQTLLRSATLTTTHLWFTVQASETMELDQHSGAALRGNFFHAIWQRFCTNQSAPTCAACPLHEVCPVSAIVAPLREDSTQGQDIPRPYIIIPPIEGPRRYQAEEQFSFGMTLFGNIVQLLPYIILSVPQLEANGLGHRLGEYQGRRGRFRVEQIEVTHPFTAERQTIYQAGKTRVNSQIISVQVAECLARAEKLDQQQITLQFVTPLRLIDRERLVKKAEFRPLFQRLLERYLALEQHYGNSEIFLGREEKIALLQQADGVLCSDDSTQWEELTSYSNRQKRSTPIGGLVGQATFTGMLTGLLGLLVVGELIHVGKNVVKGNGWYRIIS
ncbi:CRISPR system precrRNA processing endoribonuclease RAMP protein Cas6 [Tengunoibacter tsumagoiensis]|uniref:CRISPR-associated protein Cas6 C-terminal domain-containing protein n=1 Tax=Tengunoibacter tsumagoiensis TaxID=2014871 RepID=A0A401ZZI7_9CHLR|nr:CRISPR system precrRNA processing endoribonuclease RAMP protein Cas6 [Tengunoibacter tsumagoiensis]GCE12277.1 hypothetical protein KTT_21360 [Tengunoibacter tsumagoiensis]